MNNGAETKELREPLSLKRLLAFGRSRTGVLAITTGGTFVVRTISSVILTRLLTPYDFGIIGIIGAIFFAVTMVTDLGFEAFLIRHERAEDGFERRSDLRAERGDVHGLVPTRLEHGADRGVDALQ